MWEISSLCKNRKKHEITCSAPPKPHIFWRLPNKLLNIFFVEFWYLIISFYSPQIAKACSSQLFNWILIIIIFLLIFLFLIAHTPPSKIAWWRRQKPVHAKASIYYVITFGVGRGGGQKLSTYSKGPSINYVVLVHTVRKSRNMNRAK